MVCEKRYSLLASLMVSGVMFPCTQTSNENQVYVDTEQVLK